MESRLITFAHGLSNFPPEQLPDGYGAVCKDVSLVNGTVKPRPDIGKFYATTGGTSPLKSKSGCQGMFMCVLPRGDRVLFIVEPYNSQHSCVRIVRGMKFEGEEATGNPPLYTGGTPEYIQDRYSHFPILGQRVLPVSFLTCGQKLYIFGFGAPEWAPYATYQIDLNDLIGSFQDFEGDWTDETQKGAPRALYGTLYHNFLAVFNEVSSDIRDGNPLRVEFSYPPQLNDGQFRWGIPGKQWNLNGSLDYVDLAASAGEEGTGIAYLNGKLVLLCSRSLWSLDGVPGQGISVMKIADVGCVDPQTVKVIQPANDKGYVYFLGSDGVPKRTDGTFEMVENVGAYTPDGRSPIEKTMRKYVSLAMIGGPLTRDVEWKDAAAFGDTQRVGRNMVGWESSIPGRPCDAVVLSHDFFGVGAMYAEKPYNAIEIPVVGYLDWLAQPFVLNGGVGKCFPRTLQLNACYPKINANDPDPAPAVLTATIYDDRPWDGGEAVASGTVNVPASPVGELALSQVEIVVFARQDVPYMNGSVRPAKYWISLTCDVAGCRYGYVEDDGVRRGYRPYGEENCLLEFYDASETPHVTTPGWGNFILNVFRRYASGCLDLRQAGAGVPLDTGFEWWKLAWHDQSSESHASLALQVGNSPTDMRDVPATGNGIINLSDYLDDLSLPVYVKFLFTREDDYVDATRQLTSVALISRRVETSKSPPAVSLPDGSYCLLLDRRTTVAETEDCDIPGVTARVCDAALTRDILIWNGLGWSVWEGVGAVAAAVGQDQSGRGRIIYVDQVGDTPWVLTFILSGRNLNSFPGRAPAPRFVSGMLYLAQGARAATIKRIVTQYRNEPGILDAQVKLHIFSDSGDQWLPAHFLSGTATIPRPDLRRCRVNVGRFSMLALGYDMMGDAVIHPKRHACVEVSAVALEIQPVGSRDGAYRGQAPTPSTPWQG